ncbi:hypothetical protein JCM3774_006499, partial [Rhodotorula dairenensis]
VDIWSLGVILFALLTGSLPFDDDDEAVMRQLILQGKYEVPDWLDSDAASLVRSILVHDPLRRASLKEILSHPFFTGPVASSSSSSSSCSPVPQPLPVPGAASSSSAPASPPTSPPTTTTQPLPPLLNSPSLGMSDSGSATGTGLDFFAPASASSSSSQPPLHALSEVQRGKQRASDSQPPPPPSSSSPSPQPGSPSLAIGGRITNQRPSALPPHILASAASAVSSPSSTATARMIRRHPSTASIDFGPSAPAPSAPLFPPAMQRTSSAGAVSVTSVRSAAGTATSQVIGGGGGGGGGTGRRRRSIGSVRSLRMQELSEGEEATATSPPRGAVAPAFSLDGDAGGGMPETSVRRAASSTAASADEDEGDGDADGEDPEPERIDYVSLLLTTSAVPPLLSTPEEQNLLQQLSLLGFDAGQVSHSVRTSACDSCSAIWWMLRRKRDAELELEREQAAAAAARLVASAGTGRDGGDGGETGEGKLSRTSSLRSVRRHPGSIRDPAAVLNDSPDEMASPPQPPASRLYRDDFLESLIEEQGPLSPLPTVQPLELFAPTASATTAEGTSPQPQPLPPSQPRERTVSEATAHPTTARAPSPPHTPPRRPSMAPVTPAATLTSPTTVTAPATPSAKVPFRVSDDAEARLSYFLNAADMPSSASASAILSYFPTVEPSSQTTPSAKRTGSVSHSLGHDNPSSSSGGLDDRPARDPFIDEVAAVTAAEEGHRRDRARAGSVGLLARATSAIGQSLASLAQTGAADDGEEASTPRQSAPNLPPIPQAQRLTVSTTTSSPGPASRSPGPSPSRPQAIHTSASAPSTAQSYSPVMAISPLPRPAQLVVSSLPASPARAISQRALHPFEPSRASSSTGLGDAGRSSTQSLNRSTSQGGAKKNKGGNLLTTFKHWFGQDPRKRKRVSMSPRLGAVGGSDGSNPGGASVARSHSMYAGSTPARASAPLAIAGRPQLGSRKSSYNSAYAGAPTSGGSATISRRSSVSSAHRAPYYADHATPMRNGQSRRRRLSDASRNSRNSLSERGDNSRPSSVRSYGGGPGGSAARRHRHSTGGASGSPSSSYIPAKEIYRRPPTTTTVRRRHGSRNRQSAEIVGGNSSARHHRRTASGASSMHRSSSGSMIAGLASEDDQYVDDDDVGEDPILEEDEEEGGGGALTDPADQVRTAARARALRALSGGSGDASDSPAARSEGGLPLTLGATLPRSSSSSLAVSSTNTSARSSTGASSSHQTATFTAHKTTHLFGSPLQPRASSNAGTTAVPASSSSSLLSRRATIPAHVPRRDVFASKEANGEWVDEDDELAGYGGGLGQGNTGSAVTTADLSRGPSTGGNPVPASGPRMSPGLGTYADSPIAGKVWSTGGGAHAASSASVSVARFEGRYAGVAGAAQSLNPSLVGGDASVLGTGGGALAGARHPKWTQAAPDIVEEEEE